VTGIFTSGSGGSVTGMGGPYGFVHTL
jgi:hypothetical protein